MSIFGGHCTKPILLKNQWLEAWTPSHSKLLQYSEHQAKHFQSQCHWAHLARLVPNETCPVPEVTGFIKHSTGKESPNHILQPNANHSFDRRVLFASNLASTCQRPIHLLKAKLHLPAIPIPGSIAEQNSHLKWSMMYKSKKALLQETISLEAKTRVTNCLLTQFPFQSTLPFKCILFH